MIRYLIGRKISSAEKELGVSHEHLRYMADTSLSAFLTFSKIFSIAEYRKTLPVDVYHVARIVAARDEDCGACVQIEINMAQKSGLTREILKSILNQEVDSLPPLLALSYRFTEALVKHLPEENQWREKLRAEIGEEALIELAMAIGVSRFLPLVKRTMGYGISCQKMELKIKSLG